MDEIETASTSIAEIDDRCTVDPMAGLQESIQTIVRKYGSAGNYLRCRFSDEQDNS